MLGSTLNLINEEIKSDLKRESRTRLKVKEIRSLGHLEVQYRDKVFQLYDIINMRNLLTDKIAENAALN